MRRLLMGAPLFTLVALLEESRRRDYLVVDLDGGYGYSSGAILTMISGT